MVVLMIDTVLLSRILAPGQEWAELHREGGATCLASHGESLATAGQDGRINLLNIRQRNPVKVIIGIVSGFKIQ